MPRIMYPPPIEWLGPDEAYMFSVDPDASKPDFWCHYVSDWGNVIGKGSWPGMAVGRAKQRARRLEKLLAERYAP